MDNEKLKENYRIVIVKIIDYLGSQQTQNNVNESIPNIDESMAQPDFVNLEPNEAFNKYIKVWTQYYDFQALISKEFLEELQQGLIYDGILIADLRLCKKRVINEENNKDSYGSIRVNDDGIYFEEKTNNRKK